MTKKKAGMDATEFKAGTGETFQATILRVSDEMAGITKEKREAMRDSAKKNRLENGIRLGLAKPQKDGRVIWTSGNRPQEYPPRDPQKRPWLVDEKNMRGTCKARILSSSVDWLDFETEHPCKLLSLTVEISELVPITDYASGKPIGNQLERRRRLWKVPLEGEDLTYKTAWLNPSDIVSICHGEVVFCNGFKITATEGGACVASFETLPKEDGDKVLVPETSERFSTKSRDNPKQPLKGGSKQTSFSKPAHDFIESCWPEYRNMRKGIQLRATRERFIKHPKYADKCDKYGIKTAEDVRKIQDALRKQKKSMET